MADDFVEICQRLVLEGLLESEPPRAIKVRNTDALRITATGAYYWSFLVRSFAYLDLVLVDTPIKDHVLAKELATLSEKKKEDYALSTFLTFRIVRVRKFLEYLRQADELEIEHSSKQGGPYRERLSEVIINQIEKEIAVFRGKTGA